MPAWGRGRFVRWLMLTSLAVAVLGAVLFEISRARCFQLIGEITCRVETSDKLVALTFDDGPTPPGVDAVLPVLERYGVKATFFLIGQAIERNPLEARRIALAGHELANHTYSHRRMVLHWSGTYAEEIARTDALLQASGAPRPAFLRPPYGKRLIGFPMAAQRAGYRMVTWDVEEDTSQRLPQLYADRITEQVRPGSIVLMHPMFGNREVVRDALPIIIEDLQARGFQMVTVSELLRAEGRAESSAR